MVKNAMRVFPNNVFCIFYAGEIKTPFLGSLGKIIFWGAFFFTFGLGLLIKKLFLSAVEILGKREKSGL